LAPCNIILLRKPMGNR